MARVSFAQVLKRHVECPDVNVRASNVREALDAVFHQNDRLRGYVLDDQAALRKHMVVFVDGQRISDRTKLSDPVEEHSEIYVLQSLSGG